jgi:hypothetical protein
MPLFTIMHIYEVPARNQIAATDELMLARKHNFDKTFLKKVIVKDAGVKLPREKVNVFAPKEVTKKEVAKMVTIFQAATLWEMTRRLRRGLQPRLDTMRVSRSPEVNLEESSKPTHKGGELAMPTYLVLVAIPTIYVIDAKSPQRAMDKAAKRFQYEYHARITPEFQWAQLKGAANDAEWEIVD